MLKWQKPRKGNRNKKGNPSGDKKSKALLLGFKKMMVKKQQYEKKLTGIRATGSGLGSIHRLKSFSVQSSVVEPTLLTLFKEVSISLPKQIQPLVWKPQASSQEKRSENASLTIQSPSKFNDVSPDNSHNEALNLNIEIPPAVEFLIDHIVNKSALQVNEAMKLTASPLDENLLQLGTSPELTKAAQGKAKGTYDTKNETEKGEETQRNSKETVNQSPTVEIHTH